MADPSPTPSPTPTPAVGSVLYVGGYTGTEAQRVGVEGYRIGASEGPQLEVGELPAVALHSPSYLVRHPQQPVLFAVGEGERTTVSALAVGEDGVLELLNTVLSDGVGGCHLTVDETGRFVVVADYRSGSVSSFAIAADGRLSEQIDHHRFHGRGADPERQDAPHAHQVVPHAGRLLVPDLGSDVVHQLHLDPEGHLGLADDPIRLPAGSGPRHLVVTEDHLVVACELSARLWLARREGETWMQADEVGSSAEPAGPDAPCAPSALRLEDGLVYVANRGPDTVAVFALDAEHHRLRPVTELRTGGAGPRDLILSPTHLWVANQLSDSVVAHRRPRPTDQPANAGYVLDFEIPTAAPSALLLHES